MATKIHALLFAAFLVCLGVAQAKINSFSSRPADGYLTINTEYGPVAGQIENVGPFSSRVWRGIPYAAPPVGSLRFMPPQSPAPWAGYTLDAYYFSPGCPQNCDLPPYTCPMSIDESCLFLNIWAPLAAPSSPLPVMFFIHGGHYEQGSGEGPFYDSIAAANMTDVIVVTINYRLGALGWLYTPLFPGNMGLEDQLFALQFVVENIANFGGDPNSITIYGESAGGTSVAALLVSPKAAGLYQRAIIESNPFGLPIQDDTDGLALAQRFAGDMGCGSDPLDYACMNNKSWEDIIAAQAESAKHINWHDLLELFYPWVPTIGPMVPDHPLVLFMNGTAANVPIIIGTCSEEAILFIKSAFSGELASWEYDAVVLATFGTEVFKVLEMYPSQSGDNSDNLATLATDYLFVCPTRAAARGQANRGQDVYLYQFNHSLPTQAWGPNYTFCGGHVCHGSELPFVFDITYDGIFPFSPDEQALGNAMVTAWSSFGITASPQVPMWKPYQTADDTAFIWQTGGPALQSGLRARFCDFWDTVGYKF